MFGYRRYEEREAEAPWWLVRRMVVVSVLVGWAGAVLLVYLDVPRTWLYGSAGVAVLIALKVLLGGRRRERRRVRYFNH